MLRSTLAQVTFTVAGPNPVVFMATDRNWVSELITIFDSTGTTVGISLVQRAAWCAWLGGERCEMCAVQHNITLHYITVPLHQRAEQQSADSNRLGTAAQQSNRNEHAQCVCHRHACDTAAFTCCRLPGCEPTRRYWLLATASMAASAAPAWLLPPAGRAPPCSGGSHPKRPCTAHFSAAPTHSSVPAPTPC